MKPGRLLVVLLLAAGCGGASSMVETSTDLPEESGPLVLADIETFDVTRYPEEPAAPPIETVRIEHEVPAALMENRADEGVERTVSGFRVQVLATLDPQDAEQMEARVQNWWERRVATLPPGSSLPQDLSVHRTFRQPYYRVRLGDFTTRAAAEELLEVVSTAFGDAFVVPDRVTVRR